jgi:hypothetical protein
MGNDSHGMTVDPRDEVLQNRDVEILLSGIADPLRRESLPSSPLP